jgi:predicted phosphoserine aminotransferase
MSPEKTGSPTAAGHATAGPPTTPAYAAGEEFGRFFLPGPTEVHPEVLRAMERPVMGHRGTAMRDLISGLQEGLRELFGTRRPVYLSTSSATGMMEAGIANLSRKRVLCLVCGAFSRRFHDIAELTGTPADRLEVEWGQPSLPERLADRLAEDPGRYDLVTAVHSETSTGVLNPVRQLAEVVADFDDVLLAVDGVSSVGGARVEFDDWGVDYMLTGSQKALALPPGIALAVASERALRRADEVEERSHYFDLLDFERRVRKSQTPNTPAVHLFYALERQLERISGEGLDRRLERHARMAERTRGWAEELGARTGRDFGVLAPEGYRSPTVTAVTLPDELRGREVVSEMEGRGFTIGAGYGKLKDESVRIGHMGDVTPAQLDALLAELEEVLVP